jgi:hypothetical protein
MVLAPLTHQFYRCEPAVRPRKNNRLIAVDHFCRTSFWVRFERLLLKKGFFSSARPYWFIHRPNKNNNETLWRPTKKKRTIRGVGIREICALQFCHLSDQQQLVYFQPSNGPVRAHYSRLEYFTFFFDFEY